MQAYRIETKVQQNGHITLSDIPFQAGETVEVIIFGQPASDLVAQQYPLRGLPVSFDEPTESVAEADWEAIQ